MPDQTPAASTRAQVGDLSGEDFNSPALDYRLLSLKSSGEQIEWLEEQDEDKLAAINKRWGYGAVDCSCKVKLLPCPCEALTRFQQICLILDREAKLPASERNSKIPPFNKIGLLSPKKLLSLACECPAFSEPCEHTYRLLDSPLSDRAKEHLLCLIDSKNYDEPTAAPVRIWALERRAKVNGLAARRLKRYGLWRDDDSLTTAHPPAGTDEQQRRIKFNERLKRLANVLGKRIRNGQDGKPGRVSVEKVA